jgi:hypothetical protein
MVRWQEGNPKTPPILMTLGEMQNRFFPHFENWIRVLLGEKGITLPIAKHRTVATIIGAAYSMNLNPKKLTEQQWTDIVEFIRRPAEMARVAGCEWPLSKGRWSGARGYYAQMLAAKSVLDEILK